LEHDLCLVMNSLGHALTDATRGALRFPASAASGTTNEFSSNFSAPLFSSGNRRPSGTVTGSGASVLGAAASKVGSNGEAAMIMNSPDPHASQRGASNGGRRGDTRFDNEKKGASTDENPSLSGSAPRRRIIRFQNCMELVLDGYPLVRVRHGSPGAGTDRLVGRTRCSRRVERSLPQPGRRPAMWERRHDIVRGCPHGAGVSSALAHRWLMTARSLALLNATKARQTPHFLKNNFKELRNRPGP
jgi:hypothetical protein